MTQIEQFTAKMITLRDILAEPNYYAIPDMQRDYQWDIDSGKKHGRILLENITEFVEEDPNRNDCYYMGTMIVYKERGKWMVIDGQQRLTTLSLLFIAARDIFDQKTKEGVYSGELQLFGESCQIKEIGRILGRNTVGTSIKPKLLPKESSKDNFKAFMAYLVPLGTRGEFRKSRRAKLRVVQAYEMFQKEMANQFDINTKNGLQELLDFLEHILDGLAINLTEVNDLAQGYRIFSSENTTGLKLSNLDIVRALVLAQVDRKKMNDHLSEIKDKLGQMMQVLEPLSKSDQGHFIRHYWIMNYGTPMNKNKLSNSISADVKKLTDGKKAVEFVKKLRTAAKIYAENVVTADSKQKYHIPHYNLINCGFKQYRPLLLALAPRSDLTSSDFSTIFRIIETLYVRFLLIGRQKASLLEPVFAAWSKEAIDTTKTPNDLIKKWLSDALKIEEKFDFIAGFTALKITDKKKVKYLLSQIELFKDPDVKAKHLLEAEVESVLPQVKDAKQWNDTWPVFGAREHADNLQYSVGNYVLMHQKSGLSDDANWDTKKEFFINRAVYITTRDIASNISNWDKTSVNQNAMNRAKIARNIWTLDDIKIY